MSDAEDADDPPALELDAPPLLVAGPVNSSQPVVITAKRQTSAARRDATWRKKEVIVHPSRGILMQRRRRDAA